MFLLNVYGCNRDSKNTILLDQISATIKECKTKYPTDNILVGGDFNCVPDEWLGRLPAKYVSHEYSQIITNFCTSNSLIDVWRYINPNVRQFS